MRKFLILKNSILILISIIVLTSCSLSKRTASEIKDKLQNEKIERYRTIIKKDSIRLTGILLVKKKDNILIGTLINEFGLRVFSFTLKKSKSYITTSINHLDKWYIKKSLGKYLYEILINNPKDIKTYIKRGIIIKLKKI